MLSIVLLAVLGAIVRADGIRVPLEVNIGLMGFAGDGASGLELDAAELHRLLSQLLPRRQPLCGSDSTPADVTYEFTYNVVQLKTGLPALTKALAAAMRPAAASPPGHFEVPMGDIEPHLERIHASYFEHAPASGTTAGPAAYSILVLNPQRAALQSALTASARRAAGLPDEAISAFGYHYTDGAGASVVEAGAAGVPTQLWLSSGRFLVLDLAANPCAYGATDASEGALTVGAVPQVTTSAHSQLIGRLAALLTGAARQVLAPDLRTCTLPDFATELRVPLIALRNHNLFDPLKPGHEHSLDLTRLEAQLERLLLPGQTLRLLPSTHELHAHPTLAVALSRASLFDAPTARDSGRGGRASASASRTYLDAAAMTHPLSSSLLRLEPLADALADANAGAAVGGVRPYRVLPVYVLSLLGMHSELLLDHGSVVHASSEAVLVLQTNSSHLAVPYYTATTAATATATDAPPPHAMPASPLSIRAQMHTVSLRNPTAAALAGLASALGALIAPFESVRAGGAPARDFSWAAGRHPFGPFARTAGLPQVMVDSARRHVVFCRVATGLRLVRGATRALESLSARYLHAAGTELDAPELTALAAEAAAGAMAAAKAAALRADETHNGRLMEGRLMDQLRAGHLRLSSPIAHHAVLELYAHLQSPEAARNATQAALGHADLEGAHDSAGDFVRLAALASARALDEVEGLEAALGCCHVRTVRTHEPLPLVPMLLIGGAALLLGRATLWLTKPDTRTNRKRL
jgi:hypothetical protein